MQINSNVSDKNTSFIKMAFHQQGTISLYSWFFVSLVVQNMF